MATPAHPPQYENEKRGEIEVEKGIGSPGSDPYKAESVINESAELHRGLHGRHMQMIAIGMFSKEALDPKLTKLAGGSIGAGLFVGSGGALSTGGPASLVCAAKSQRQEDQKLTGNRP
jgi:amino acid transporter